MNHSIGQLAVDEFGNKYIILKDQEEQTRVHGIEAIKANIIAARSVSETIRTSLGPKGMDKIIIGRDGDVTVTNDGATILRKMQIDHQVGRLLVELSQSQDDEIGDGTTGVVVFAGALLDQAYNLIEKGIHPLRVADGFEKACEIAVLHMDHLSQVVDIQNDGHAELIKSAITALGSKLVSSAQQHLAEIAVKAILQVADLERKDVVFDLIRVEGKVGGSLNDSCLIDGIVFDKEFSHPQMTKKLENPKICILTCPFEPPKPKTKHKINLQTADEYNKLYAYEQKCFTDYVDKIKESGADLVLCQWGFDDEANHLLYQRGLHAVRWVGGCEIEILAIATGAKIVARFEELSPQKLGKAGVAREISMGTTTNSSLLCIEDCSQSRAVTVLLRGGNQMAVDEAKRCLHDALCCVRNLVRDNRVVAGGGSSELSTSLCIHRAAEKEPSVEQYSMRAFADALEVIPLCLAENSGLQALSTVASVKKEQVLTGNHHIGVNCTLAVTSDMWKQGIYESRLSKIQQLRLATQVVKMILKIDDVIVKDE